MVHQLSGSDSPGSRALSRPLVAGRPRLVRSTCESIVKSGLAIAMLILGCSNQSVTSSEAHTYLEAMEKASIQVNGHPFQVWLALSDKQRERGLMYVPAEELAATAPADNSEAVQRGMLFVFPDEQELAFWMLNTITPLDIAYISADGRIVQTYTMAPLETRTYSSIEPAQFALEAQAGVFAQLGIAAGQHVEIPDSVLKAGS
jgi:uncharacterized membrane protein (UPF0127 family)